MIYRESGQFKTSYRADSQIFPILQDRVGISIILMIALIGVPFFAGEYWINAILIPFLIFSLAAMGLNFLTGYAGQLSLGSAAFMAVGAYAAYNFQLRVEGIPFLVSFFMGGCCAAVVGVLFGLPSLRIKGFYLAVATLAAQFFVVWCLTKFPWFSNNSSSGVISAQNLELLGFRIKTPETKYLLVLIIVILMSLLGKNLVRSSTGRSWMAVRDMDVAAEVIGIHLMKTKLLAFAISSFYCGLAGVLYAYCYLGAVEPDGFSLELSFKILFMVIIGGVGSILGNFLGAAFILLLPIFLDIAMPLISALLSLPISNATVSHVQVMVFGALIIFFLIIEPHGLARLWSIAKEKLRLWPFPH